MKPGEFLEMVQHTTYKPGYEIRAMERPEMHQLMQVQLIAKVPNVHQPTNIIRVTKLELLPFELLRSLGQTETKHWLRRFICDLEHHEVDEWLKIGGEHVRRPH